MASVLPTARLRRTRAVVSVLRLQSKRSCSRIPRAVTERWLITDLSKTLLAKVMISKSSATRMNSRKERLWSKLLNE